MVLYTVGNPINRQERQNLNDTFADINKRFRELQQTLRLITNNDELDTIIERVEIAINNAQQSTDDSNAALIEVQNAIAQVNQLILDSGQLNTDVQTALNNLNEELSSLKSLGEYDANATYLKNNIVRNGRDSFISLKTNTGIVPSDDGVNWRILAVGGMDGLGSVSTVNGISPDQSGDIKLPIASKSSAESGVNDTDLMTPLRTRESTINFLENSIATTAEAQGGTNNAKIMSPLRVNEAITNKAVLKNTPDNSNVIYGNKGTVTRIIEDVQIPGDGYYGNISIVMPKVFFSGVIDVNFQSQFVNSNAGGGARVLYQFGGTNQFIYANEKNVMEVSSLFATQYTVSGLFDSGSNYIFALEKLNNGGSNAIRIEITFSGTGDVYGFANGTTFTTVNSDQPTTTPALVGIRQEIENLKSASSNGIARVAAAITGKGITTAATSSFTQLSSNIMAIPEPKTNASGIYYVTGDTAQFITLARTVSNEHYVYFANPLNVIPKYVSVTYSNGTIVQEATFDSTRPIPFNNAIVNNVYSTGQADSGVVYSFDATNNITSGYIRMPVREPGLNYEWYIEI